MKVIHLVVCGFVVISLFAFYCYWPIADDDFPSSPVDLDSLTMIHYIDNILGLNGVVPAGWVEAYPREYPGVFISGLPENRPSTTLLQRLEPNLTADEFMKSWLRREGKQEFPQMVGNLVTNHFTWDIHNGETESTRGKVMVDIALTETIDGVYSVELWTPIEEYDALHEAVFIPVVEALAPESNVSSNHTYSGLPVVASIQNVGNNADESVDFTLSKCTRLRIYAIGEAVRQEMVDYGYVEDLSTGQIPWQMYYFETESAGYYRNRLVDRPLILPSGKYRLHYQTNMDHSFEDWGERPPEHSLWGITLYEETDPQGSPCQCWLRAVNVETLGWSEEKLRELDSCFEELEITAAMVVTDGQVVLEWGNTANNFHAHSMRKSLLSALYGIYAEDGEIDISRTLVELGIDDITPLTKTEKQATVQELLQARSGIYIPAGGEAPEMSASRPKRGSHPHGTHWYYNNWDFNALGSIFDQLTQEPNIYQAFKTRIADPIGMQDFFPEKLDYLYYHTLSQHPYYLFRISARDLARFGQLYLQNGEWTSENNCTQNIVPVEWVKDSLKAYSKTGQTGTYSGYGYMWWIAAEDFSEISEGSFCASGYGGHTLEVLPHLDTVVVLRFNTDLPGYEYQGSVDEITLRILEARN